MQALHFYCAYRKLYNICTRSLFTETIPYPLLLMLTLNKPIIKLYKSYWNEGGLLCNLSLELTCTSRWQSCTLSLVANVRVDLITMVPWRKGSGVLRRRHVCKLA